MTVSEPSDAQVEALWDALDRFEPNHAAKEVVNDWVVEHRRRVDRSGRPCTCPECHGRPMADPREVEFMDRLRAGPHGDVLAAEVERLERMRVESGTVKVIDAKVDHRCVMPTGEVLAGLGVWSKVRCRECEQLWRLAYKQNGLASWERAVRPFPWWAVWLVVAVAGLAAAWVAVPSAWLNGALWWCAVLAVFAVVKARRWFNDR